MKKIFFRFWRLLLFVSILAFGSSAIAQRTVTGVIMDGALNEPLIGGTVQVKGTTTGTVTDLDGKFSIKVAGPSDVLVISYVGYESQEVVVGNQTAINLTLKESAQQLDELVVIGYGVVKKSDLTGSVAVVGAEELTKTPAATFDRALQGKASGVMVTQNTGKPGEGVSIRIRGVGSIDREAQPLYIVDGVQTGSLTNINPNDIETMQVLKDASAAAIYGAQGANGVVLIQTKRGKSGAPKIALTSNWTTSFKPKQLDIMNADEYSAYMAKVYEASGSDLPAAYTDEKREENYGAGWEKGTNWQDEIAQTGFAQNYNLSISGGNETSNYSVSGNYYDDRGILKTTGVERFGLRANSDFYVGKYIKVGESLSVSRMAFRDDAPKNGNSWDVATKASPLLPIYDSSNTLGGYYRLEDTVIGLNEQTNPLAELQLNDERRFNTNILANIYAEVKILKVLTFKTSPSIEYSLSRARNWNPEYDLGSAGNRSHPQNELEESHTDFRRLMWDNILSYNQSFGKHNITAMAGQSMLKDDSNFFRAKGQALPYSFIQVLDQTPPDKGAVAGNVGINRLTSYFGRVMYDFDSKYLFTASLRRDASSKFGIANNSGVFPSFSVGWKINEDFLQNVDEISMLKLRAGWGQTGNADIGDFRYADYITPSNQFRPTFGDQPSVVNAQNIYYSFANPVIRWEAASMTNIGVDLSLLRNKWQISAEYYYKKNAELLVQVPTSFVFGRSGDGSMPWTNLGDMTNRGFEFTTTYRKLEGEFNYGVTANVTTIKNRVDYLPTENVLRNNNITVENHSIGSLYGYVAERIIQEEDFDESGNYLHAVQQAGTAPGDIKFKDLNQDGVIDDDDRTIIGKTIPDFVYSLNLDFSYKGWDLTIFFNGVQNVDVYNQLRSRLELGTDNPQKDWNRYRSAADNYWTPENRSNEYVRLLNSDPNNNARTSTWFIEDGSFLRLKDIQLGYSFPKKWLDKVNVSTARVYLSGSNLYTFTKYSGIDPEVATMGRNALESGVDNGSYPLPRAVTLGLQLDF